MRKTVLYYFPDYKKNPTIQAYHGRQRLLLEMLERPEDLTQKELIMVKYRYLESLAGTE
jgi:hypothetical protein